MSTPAYTEEETEALSDAFKRLRKAKENRKVPFFWVEKAADGQPRLLVGKPSLAKVPQQRVPAAAAHGTE